MLLIFCGKLHACWLTQLWLVPLHHCLIARRCVGPHTKCLLPSQFVSEVCVWLSIALVHRGPVFNFIVLWHQMLIETFASDYICIPVYCIKSSVARY